MSLAEENFITCPACDTVYSVNEPCCAECGLLLSEILGDVNFNGVLKRMDLEYCRGRSDKVYSIALSSDQGEYIVVAFWGRRGYAGTKQEKLRTKNRFLAENMFMKILGKKREKGYVLTHSFIR